MKFSEATTDFHPSSPADRMESGVEFVDEFLQLLCIDVADGKEFETPCGPAPNVEPLHRLIRPTMFRPSSLRDEEIDHMRSAPIDDRSDGSPVNIVEPPPISVKPCAVRSTTGGATSTLPLNHGFTVCWSLVCTSVRWSP